MNYSDTHTTSTAAATTATDTPVPVTGNLLVHYSTTRAGLSVTHKRLTAENCGSTGADPKALRTVARIFESRGTAIGKIYSLFAQTRDRIAQLGLKLSTGGHLIRADRLEEIHAIFDASEDQLDRLRGELRREYAGLINKSRASLGTAANDLELPTAGEATAKFTQRIELAPDPTAGQVLLEGVSDEVAAKVRSQIDTSRSHILQEAQESLIRELLCFVTGSGGSDQGILGVLGSDECRVYQSRFTRLKDRLEVAKGYDWEGSDQLKGAIAALQPIADADVDVIRGDGEARKELEGKAKTAVSSVASILGDLGILTQ